MILAAQDLLHTRYRRRSADSMPSPLATVPPPSLSQPSGVPSRPQPPKPRKRKVIAAAGLEVRVVVAIQLMMLPLAIGHGDHRSCVNAVTHLIAEHVMLQGFMPTDVWALMPAPYPLLSACRGNLTRNADRDVLSTLPPRRS